MTDNPAGFTPELRAICEDRCAEVGDPACWLLPELVEPCEHITPCAECLNKVRGKPGGGERMKLTSQTDDEWSDELAARKVKAEREMLIADHKKGFATLGAVMSAARLWGVDQHTAEMRLMRGELPDGFNVTQGRRE